eukprot:747721-Hanusia_phi.AAC.2
MQMKVATAVDAVVQQGKPSDFLRSMVKSAVKAEVPAEAAKHELTKATDLRIEAKAETSRAECVMAERR